MMNETSEDTYRRCVCSICKEYKKCNKDKMRVMEHDGKTRMMCKDYIYDKVE